MGAVLAGGCGAVMTGCTGSRSDVSVIEGCRNPAISRMTVIAVVVTGNVVSRLAQCRGAVVTAEAGAQYRGMINPGHRGPGTGIGAVTVLAQIRGLDVRAGLTGRGRAVVSACAIASHRIMVHTCKRLPELIRVTFLAQQIRPNMILRQLVCGYMASLIVTSRTRCRSSLK